MAKRVSPALSLAELRSLLRLRRETDAAYNGFWIAALAINKPPKPPGFKKIVRSLVRQLRAHEKRILAYNKRM
jgi:hypothetical protein